MTEAAPHQPTRAAVAAGALFTDDENRIMLVRPTYKEYWDIPGGYVEPGETPHEACVREVAEELGIHPTIGRLLVADWAPHPQDGDKILFVFDGGHLTPDQHAAIKLGTDELAEYRYVTLAEAEALTIPRLLRRLSQAVTAYHHTNTLYLEEGTPRTSSSAG